jgi:hypothetical protein
MRWWPGALAAAVAVLLPVGTCRAEEAGDKGSRGIDKKKVSATLKTIIARGADLYNARDYAGCYRFFQGSLATLRPFLDRHPKTQRAIDASLAEAERDPRVQQRCWVLYRSLTAIYTSFTPGAKKTGVGKGPKDKNGKGLKKDRKAKDKPAKDSGQANQAPEDKDKDVPKDLFKDVKKVDKSSPARRFLIAKKGQATVSGKVVFKGLPVGGGKVFFHPKKGKPFMARTAKDGTYTIKGLKLENYIVTVISRKHRVPPKYGNPKTSGLTVTLSATNEAFDIAIQ